jgi:hypothetical protein
MLSSAVPATITSAKRLSSLLKLPLDNLSGPPLTSARPVYAAIPRAMLTAAWLIVGYTSSGRCGKPISFMMKTIISVRWLVIVGPIEG